LQYAMQQRLGQLVSVYFEFNPKCGTLFPHKEYYLYSRIVH
jgi:hypothetical protein